MFVGDIISLPALCTDPTRGCAFVTKGMVRAVNGVLLTCVTTAHRLERLVFTIGLAPFNLGLATITKAVVVKGEDFLGQDRVGVMAPLVLVLVGLGVAFFLGFC